MRPQPETTKPTMTNRCIAKAVCRSCADMAIARMVSFCFQHPEKRVVGQKCGVRGWPGKGYRQCQLPRRSTQCNPHQKRGSAMDRERSSWDTPESRARGRGQGHTEHAGHECGRGPSYPDLHSCSKLHLTFVTQCIMVFPVTPQHTVSAEEPFIHPLNRSVKGVSVESGSKLTT